MKSILPILSIVLISCSTAQIVKTYYGDTYKYKYELSKPVADTSLRYEDDKMKFDFIVGSKQIDFTAKNKTDQPLKVIWDEASIVIFGKADKIMHKGVKYIDRGNSMPPTTIPAFASIDELAAPASNVYYREGYYGTYVSNPGGWESHDIFPTQDLKKDEVRKLINSVKGQDVVLYLPVKDASGKEFGYSFVFKVADVSCLTCNQNTSPPNSKTKKGK